MNRNQFILTSFIAVAFVSLMPRPAVAQFFFIGTQSVKLTATVVGPGNTPIPGAQVTLILNQMGEKLREKAVEGVTGANGVVKLSGRASESFFVYVSKDGYYRHESQEYGTRPAGSDEGRIPGVFNMTIQLDPIRNPAPFKQRSLIQATVPAYGSPFSYDVEVGDWTRPHGKGVVPDFTFLANGYMNSLRDLDETLVLTFANASDGIIPIVSKPKYGSKLKFPYEAPESGYLNSFQWRRTVNASGVTTTYDHRGTRSYIFRVRSETDATGKVTRAMYGVIYGEFAFGGNINEPRMFTFHSIANPDRSRNIEFDLDKVFEDVHEQIREARRGGRGVFR